MRGHANKVSQGECFEFCTKWARFLVTFDGQCITQAESLLKGMLVDASI